MPTVSDMFPKPHIVADDLKGKAFSVTINGVRQVPVWDSQKNADVQKWALDFAEAKKYLILNKTNADAIAEILGSTDTADWNGGTVVLYPTQTQAFGKTHDVVRVRAPENGEEPLEIVDEPELDEEPF